MVKGSPEKLLHKLQVCLLHSQDPRQQLLLAHSCRQLPANGKKLLLLLKLCWTHLTDERTATVPLAGVLSRDSPGTKERGMEAEPEQGLD